MSHCFLMFCCFSKTSRNNESQTSGQDEFNRPRSSSLESFTNINTDTNQNSIHEEIKCRLKAGNSCYYSVQTLLSSRLLSKNLKIKIYKAIILPVVLYGCATWSLTLREESRLRVFENRILRRIFGP